ncbi:MAG: hypothetical protein B6244_11045 [Candidatus Cloacimonetes bacterium 4572_55]|nr:MAG: hypothetical protein B6244_11045 [Candidatus Cloacimonetes bacterium 4572_55]
MTVIKLFPDVDFDPVLFVNREKEIDEFLKVYGAETNRKNCLLYASIPGQGKTRLLEKFCYLTQEKGGLAAFVDLESHPERKVSLILKEVVDHLKFLHNDKGFFDDFYRNIDACGAKKSLQKPNRPAVAEAEKCVIREFKKTLTSLMKTYRITLCFDSLEQANPDIFRLLKEKVLEDYFFEVNLTIVFAGQKGMVEDARRFMRDMPLALFGREDERKQIESLVDYYKVSISDIEEITRLIWDLAKGHPYTVKSILGILTDDFNEKFVDKFDKRRYSPIIRELKERVVEKRFLRGVDFDPRHPDPIEILSILSPLRRVEFGTIRLLLSNPNLTGDAFCEKSIRFYDEVVDKFVSDTNTLKHWVLGGGFTMDPVVRNILYIDLKINDLERFLHIHEALVMEYDKRIKSTAKMDQVKNLIEKIYHLFVWRRESEDAYAEEIARREFYRFIESLKGSKVDKYEQLGRLRKELEKDRELGELVNTGELVQRIKDDMRRIGNEIN